MKRRAGRLAALLLAALLASAGVAAAGLGSVPPAHAATPGGTVVAWGCVGYPDAGQCSVPAGLSGVTAIAAGDHHSLALRSDGTVVAWGCQYNDNGQCSVPAGLSGVTAIAAGADHSLALKSDGSVVAWGGDGNGQTDVPVGLSGVTAIAAGHDHSLALLGPATVTVTLGNLSQQYDGTAKSASASVSPSFCGPVTLSYSQNGTPVSAPTAAGSYTVQASLGNSACAIDAGGTGTLVITPAQLIIVPNNQSMTYGGPLPAFTVSYDGLVNGDTGNVVQGLSCGATDASGKPVSSSTPVGQYRITCSASAANYSVRSNDATLTINPAPLTITANDKSMTYGGRVPASFFDASYAGFVNGDTAASLSNPPQCQPTGPAHSLPVGTYPITCIGAQDPNYSISYQPGTLAITPAPLTIMANNQSMTYGGTVPAFTVSYSGLVNFDTGSVVAGLSCGATDAAGNPVSGSTPTGTYAITCSGGSAANYSIAYQGGTLTIAPAPQAITFGALPNHRLGDAPFSVMATGGASGNPVTFSAGPAAVCTAGGTNGATITLVGVGACTVTASQAGTANYLAAPSVTQSFTVSAPPLSLALSLSSSPAGPVTTGSTVTASLTLGNHTTASQTVTLTVTLTYTGSHGTLRVTVPLKLTLSAGQTLSRSTSFKIQSCFPRGAYTLSATATDGSGDTASSSTTLSVS